MIFLCNPNNNVERKLFRKMCIDCLEMYVPNGRRQKLCEDCKKKPEHKGFRNKGIDKRKGLSGLKIPKKAIVNKKGKSPNIKIKSNYFENRREKNA